jgi:putative membrane protein insertion efficiency factor
MDNSMKNKPPLRSSSSIFAIILVGFVRFYQLFLSPLLGSNCRYQPTCSHYAIEAMRVHGGLKGGWLAIRRIIRCHPWGGFGYDPIPDVKTKQRNSKHYAGDNQREKQG